MEGHGDKVDCCSAAEIGTCCNYNPINGKVFTYLLHTEAQLLTPPADCSLKNSVISFHIGFKIPPLFPGNVKMFVTLIHLIPSLFCRVK